MDKVYEKKHAIPFALIEQRIGEQLVLFRKKYKTLQEDYQVLCRWSPKTRTILIWSKVHGVRGKIVFEEKTFVLFADIPFHLRILGPTQVKQILNLIIKEIIDFLHTIKQKQH